MDKNKAKAIAIEAEKLYFKYDCTPVQALEKAKELYESKERGENELKRCFDIMYQAVKGEQM
ncbi:hypothetical protein [Garciella nitratireducens]|uniref:Uncharacterized protein n=1 Tax=Garciella nitratireducens DSM 15102 TaxID=1121911 RepID=A0A1T4K743_9FIRM|nr:hypothetical protein [Garciella nitratireducens]SJZ38244.1 hypothetical protein SAMN02745973_00389 [Garciella nitratireducens DSM 15102]